jgi:hypothetical protein
LENREGEIKEDTPDKLKSGYLVVILDNDERKTLLELIINIFGYEEVIDKYLIESWQLKLKSFMEHNNLSIAKLQELLKKKWLR